ncbi:prepilin-type N-terminal cleavage/methylation domain-containing protein [Pseudomonas sp. FP2196]|uniref:prepilin-type N-terminal cleavage/methylation domain-containing protein n=1 Tax=Pseudomonas sp. FP2196 TaxID=2954086 RepID=UPI002732302A|nr:prepilin-type N-terminal cleavage/methylation domain-containing protein [Pseudomonas sp. FP2196]WLH33064.1 prepilin-type N-terminal cleavage/methylation domain-containing protein [Pseudomonas sp. FP2196]
MRRNQRGFTLLEVLVVISLLGVLLTLIGAAIAGANRAMAKAERYGSRLDEVRSTQNFLRSAIGQALPLAAGKPGQAGSPIFQGDGQSLSFYAPLPATLGGGLYRHEVNLVDGRLQVSVQRLQGETLQPAREPQVLLQQVKAVRVSYRGLSPEGKSSEWLDHWPWPGRLPRAVRIDVQLGGAIVWPLQIIRLRLDLSGENSAP